MDESFAQQQVRLHLEGECARAFMVLRQFKAIEERCPLTLIAFDYGDGAVDPFAHVAFKTSLDRKALIRTVEALLRSWSRQTPRVVSRQLAERVRLPDTDAVLACRDLVRSHLRESVGFAILFGVGECVYYVATGDREGVRELFERILLPAWREELG